MKDKVLRANVRQAVEHLCHELRAYSGESMTFTLTVITRAKGAVSECVDGIPDWYKANAVYTEAADKDDCIMDDSFRLFYGPDDFGEETIVAFMPYKGEEAAEEASEEESEEQNE